LRTSSISITASSYAESKAPAQVDQDQYSKLLEPPKASEKVEDSDDKLLIREIADRKEEKQEEESYDSFAATDTISSSTSSQKNSNRPASADAKAQKKKSHSDPNTNAVRKASLLSNVEVEKRPNSCSEPLMSENYDTLSGLDKYKRYQISKTLQSSKQQKKEALKPHRSSCDIYAPDKLHGEIPDFENQFELGKEEKQFREMCDILTSSTSQVSIHQPDYAAPPTGQVISHSRSCSAPVNPTDGYVEASRRYATVEPLEDMKDDEELLGSKKGISTSADNLNASGELRGKYLPELRWHVVHDLLDTETSYLNSLKVLCNEYLVPLRNPENQSICEPRLVEEIFFQIPEILQKHEELCADIQSYIDNWDTGNMKIGELFLNFFHQEDLIEAYISFVRNFSNATECISKASQAKSAFKTFLENRRAINKDKQSLSARLIQPVQRIPRYKLYFKEFLKYTAETHCDHAGLTLAIEECHNLATLMDNDLKSNGKSAKRLHNARAQENGSPGIRKYFHQKKVPPKTELATVTNVNEGKTKSDIENLMKNKKELEDIESIIENFPENLILSKAPRRKFVQQETCMELGKQKERKLWLFNDLLVCTSTGKKKNLNARRSSINIASQNNENNSKYETAKCKFQWHIWIREMEFNTEKTEKENIKSEIDSIMKDQLTLKEIEKKVESLKIDHQNLGNSIKELQAKLASKLQDKVPSCDKEEACEERKASVVILNYSGGQTVELDFFKEETKSFFEDLLKKWKKITKMNGDFPAFTRAIPISKTRNGMQFSCATANTDTSPSTHEVWVCNTDGYVGQICFLALEPEPSQTQCITVCNAKISCITQVPTWDKKLIPTKDFLDEIEKAPLGHSKGRHNSVKSSNHRKYDIIAWDDTDETDEDNTSPMSTLSSRSPYSTNNSTSNRDAQQMYGSTATTNNVRSDDKTASMTSLLGGGAFKKESNGSTLHGSLEDLLATESLVDGSRNLSNHGSMWLGTEDGKIKIYSTQESIRSGKCCVDLQCSAAVQCILYHGSQVFVALSNGTLNVYQRDPNNGRWDLHKEKLITLAPTPITINKMLVVNGTELWCGCQNVVRVLDVRNHSVIRTFTISNDPKRSIQCMASCGYGVWIAMDKRSIIKLYHSVHQNQLTEINVHQAVDDMLKCSDAIIRQHKAACLRITSLLVCSDLLWVGTSGGVVLTLQIPSIVMSTTSIPNILVPRGLPYGHTGHVRFLTAVKYYNSYQGKKNSLKRSSTKRKHSSVTSSVNQSDHSYTVVISGGDGYEDFSSSGASSTPESSGREDSTNHLLMWRV